MIHRWKDSVEERLIHLEGTVSQLSRRAHEQLETDSSQEGLPTQNVSLELQHGDTGNEQHGWEVIVDGNDASAAVPASYISEISTPALSKRTLVAPQKQPDMIARNVLHARSAGALFDFYRDKLDQFLYGILGASSSLSEARLASPLLVDAVCTVAALHTTSENYASCRAVFMQQVSTQMFSKRKSPDDVRGLCIAAFWLSDISWSLMGLGKLLKVYYLLVESADDKD